MAQKLFTELDSESGITYRVEIHEADYVGAVTEFKCNNFELPYEGESAERFNPLMPSRLRLNYVVQTAAEETGFLTELIDSPEDRFVVRVLREGSLHWVGSLLQDVVQYEDISYPYYFTLTAVDGLGRLSETDYRPLPQNGAAYTGRETVLSHIYNALREVPANRLFADTTPYLFASVSWAFANMPQNVSFLQETEIDHAVFTKEDKTGAKIYSNCFDVLTEICRVFGARLYFDDGAWQFVQINQYRHASRMLYIYQKNKTLVTANSSPWLTVASPNCERGGSFTFLPPLRKVEVAYKHLRPDNLASGAFFSYQTDNFSPSTTFTFAERVQVDIAENFTLKFRGVVNLNTFLLPTEITNNFGGTFPKHRYKFGLRLRVSTRYVKRYAHINFFYAVAEDPITFELNGPHNYDVYSDIIDESKNGVAQQIVIEFESPESPNEGAGVIEFYLIEIEDEFGNQIDPADGTFHWSMENPIVKVKNAQELDESSADSTRVYTANGNTGNSKKLSYPVRLGDGPNVNSISRLTWSGGDTSNWVANTGDTAVKVSQLLANEILSGQQSAVRVYQGSYINHLISPTRLITRNSYTYVMRGGTLDALRDTWRGQWFAIAYTQATDNEEVVYGEEVIKKPDEGIYQPDNPNTPTGGGGGGGGGIDDPTNEIGNPTEKSAGKAVLSAHQDFQGVAGKTITITNFDLPDPAAMAEAEVKARLTVWRNGRKLQYGIFDDPFTKDFYIDTNNRIGFQHTVTAREYIEVKYLIP